MPSSKAQWGHLSQIPDSKIFVEDSLMLPVTRDMVEIRRARCLAGKAYALSALGERTRAESAFLEAEKLLEGFISEGRVDLEYELVVTLLNHANLLRELDRRRDAIRYDEQLILRLRRLIDYRGRKELVRQLAYVYGNKAASELEIGDVNKSLASLGLCIQMLEKAASQFGREVVAYDLARFYANRARTYFLFALATLKKAGLFNGLPIESPSTAEPGSLKGSAVKFLQLALADYDQALATYPPMQDGPATDYIKADEAMDQVGRGLVTWYLGDREEAIRRVRSAFPILLAELERTGRADLRQTAQDLAQSYPELMRAAGQTADRPSGAVEPATGDTRPRTVATAAGAGAGEEAKAPEAGDGSHKERGLSQLALDRFEEARAEFSAAIQLDPRDAESHRNLGRCYRKLGRYDEALASYGEAQRLVPDDPQIDHERAKALVAAGRLQDALADFAEALRLDPKRAEAYFDRGAAYHTLKDLPKAIDDFSRVIRLAPQLSPAYINRGRCYRALGRHDEALADFDEAIRLNPTEGQVYADRGETYRVLHRRSAARADFEAALRISPDQVKAIAGLGVLHLEDNEAETALSEFDRAISLDPQSAEIRVNRGTAYHRLGRYAEAIADFDEALRLSPEFAAAMANRGLSLAELGAP